MTAQPIAKSEPSDIMAVRSQTAAVLRICGCLFWTLTLAVPQSIMLGLGMVALPRRLARLYWRGMAAILGIRVILRGNYAERQPVLYVANHASYLDIVALGAVLDAAFVAKAEIAGWPGISIIAKLGRTVFVDRKRGQSVRHRNDMLDRLTKVNESLILFPEGTSHDGNRVRSFKSALFSAAETKDRSGRPLCVQPVTVAYTRLDGMPIGRSWRPLFTWYGDMDLAPHLLSMIGLGNTTVEIELHPPVSLEQFPSRKELAEHCFSAVANGLATANAGRLPELPELPPKPM